MIQLKIVSIQIKILVIKIIEQFIPILNLSLKRIVYSKDPRIVQGTVQNPLSHKLKEE